MSRRRKSAIVQRLEYALYRLVSRMVRHASDRSITRWGNRVGSFAQRILRSRDRLAMRNLLASFPEKSADELRSTLDACWHHFGREALGYIRLQHLPASEIVERCPFVHAELLEQAIARGRGVVLISAHFGGWEVAGLAVMSLVANVRTVARPLDNDLLERDLQRIRARTGAEVLDKNKAARGLLKALSQNAVVVLLPDQAVLAREGMEVPFLGRAAWTTDAPAKMALRNGSTIVFAFCIPDGTRHRLEFEEPIDVAQLQNEERSVASLTRRINDVISRRIIEDPHLWLWMHDRWKGTAQVEGQTTDPE